MTIDDKITTIFNEEGLHFGRCLGSKSRYYSSNQENVIIFNARIYDLDTYERYKDDKIKDFFEGQKIELWYGDLDLNKDIYKLYKITGKLNKDIVITTEIGRKVIEISY
ncbi:MAG: hypothetical protein ABH824_07575 [Nanoarchaeota archaeon]|nr:hypothetical protein [Nanoarchaeota archaeon]MBU1632279.1 hypothetical protein [Nanoarchaeota archaeon]MBU1876156.1 hypothetical protein [Nanoarchaeota archaeon]